MSGPEFCFYPVATGTLQRVTFGSFGEPGLQDLQWSPRVRVIDAYGGDDVGYRSHLGTRQRVRIILDRFGSPGPSGLERLLVALQSHLQRGGLVGFTADNDKWWAAKLSGAFLPERGDTSISFSANGLLGWNASAALVADDEIVLESPHPESQLEVVPFDEEASPGTWDLGAPVIFTYTDVVLARYRHCFPVAWLPEDQLAKPIIFGDHFRNYTLDLTLEWSAAWALSLWDGGDPDLRDQGLGDSLQELVRGGTI